MYSVLYKARSMMRLSQWISGSNHIPTVKVQVMMVKIRMMMIMRMMMMMKMG